MDFQGFSINEHLHTLLGIYKGNCTTNVLKFLSVVVAGENVHGTGTSL